MQVQTIARFVTAQIIDSRRTAVHPRGVARPFAPAAQMLVCTDAAAEGINFQFCGAVINYDIPWSSMRVEQRIGRVDRLGQQHERIKIVNLQYRVTVETDVYIALRERINLFEGTVTGTCKWARFV
jgi:ERCC4-related helicase